MNVLFNNFASGTLLLDIAIGDLTLELDMGQGAFFPQPVLPGDYSVLVIEDVVGNKEVVHMTDRVVDVFTITRGEEGTIPGVFAAGSRVELRATAGFLSAFIDAGTY